MALAIRLSRGGRKKRPFYKIVVADKRMPRDGRFIEKLGTYNPLLSDDDKRVTLKEERIQYWLGQGAQPSDRVARFLGKAGLAPMPEIRETPKKSAPGEKAKERIAEKEEKLKAAEEAAQQAEEEAKAAAEAPAEEAAETPTEEAPAAEAEAAPAEEEAAEEAPAEEAEAAPAEEAPAEEPKAEEAPAEEAAEEEKKEG